MKRNSLEISDLRCKPFTHTYIIFILDEKRFVATKIMWKYRITIRMCFVSFYLTVYMYEQQM